jgi:hypothetical protein
MNVQGRHATLVWIALVLGLSSCAAIKTLDVCGERGPAPHDVNTRTDGDQTIEPSGLAATVGGGALVVFTSTDTLKGESEVRRTRLGSNAVSRPTCDTTGEPPFPVPNGEGGANFDSAVTASPTASGEAGIVVWREVLDGRFRLWAADVMNNGCIAVPLSVAPPVLIADPGPNTILGFVHAVALGPRAQSTSREQRYAISWWEMAPSDTQVLDAHIFGVVARFPLAAYSFQPTVHQPDGSKASLPPDGDIPSNHALVKLEDGTFGLLWYEHSVRHEEIRFVTLDDTFQVVAGPITLATQTTLVASDANISLAAAYDGSQILAAWVVADEKSGGHAYATFLNSEARLLRSERSPDGKPFRLGSTEEASETDLSIAPLNGGGFLAAWTERNTRDHAPGTHIRGIGFSAEGRVLFARGPCDRTDFTLSTERDGDQSKPQLATLDDQTILLLYTNLGGTDTNDPSGTGIRGTGLKPDNLFVR